MTVLSAQPAKNYHVMTIKHLTEIAGVIELNEANVSNVNISVNA